MKIGVRFRVVNFNAEGRILWRRSSVPAGSIVVDEFGEFVLSRRIGIEVQ
jgi:hypothetical protein